MVTPSYTWRLATHAYDLDADGHDTLGGVTDLDDLTDVTITSPAVGDRLRWNGTAWVNSPLLFYPVMAYDGTNWYVVVDGAGTAVMAEG